MIGQVLAVVILIAAVVLFFPMGDRWSGAWILALGLFLFVAARTQWRDAADRPEVLEHPVGELRRELPAPLSPRASVAELEAVLRTNPRAVFVPVLDERGAVGALVTRDAVARIPPANRASVPIRSLAEPLVALPRPPRRVGAGRGRSSRPGSLVVGPGRRRRRRRGRAVLRGRRRRPRRGVRLNARRRGSSTAGR